MFSFVVHSGAPRGTETAAKTPPGRWRSGMGASVLCAAGL